MIQLDDQPLGECPCCGDLYNVTDYITGAGELIRRDYTCPHEGEQP
ncbi:hypothetical protein L5G28_07630 [Gordonia sp. HY285]|nr:hypothetical protein [Gordonia liuliyuniae]MCF8610031.1 hypothetical protein [Gordonia liuliyuniae]